jgi:hypothetical protein
MVLVERTGWRTRKRWMRMRREEVIERNGRVRCRLVQSGLNGGGLGVGFGQWEVAVRVG